MRRTVATLAALASLATASAWHASSSAQAGPTPTPCAARAAKVNDVTVHWFETPQDDAAELEQWCHGVGVPVVSVPATASTTAPPLDELVVVSWNAHLAEGRLTELIDDLRSGRLTNGHPVAHFVLLLQELYRRGSDVPDFSASARSAYAITARDPDSPDAREYAERLGVSLAYVPSMRNGAQMKEDRGNAIISSEPLHDLFAVELPFERQRRVAVGAAIAVQTPRGVERLQVVDTHLEPLASPANLWILRNPRRRQVTALLDLLQQPRFQHDAVGTVIGGDFNTVQGGAREEAYRRVRSWATSLGNEDRRSTHMLGRLDYIFGRLTPGWQVDTMRIEEKYGSDHHPVLARFHRRAPPSKMSE
jgi:endonuclease/exonuclease/phosphatase family metal-dependent hydrolase